MVASDPSLALSAAHALARELEARNIRFGDALLPTSIKPHLLNKAHNEERIRGLTRLVELLENAARYFLADRALRKGPLFSARAWELFDIDPGYGRFAVLCRPDMVWHGGRALLLEMNADSPAMMVYADHIQELQQTVFPLDRMRLDDLEFHGRTRALLRAFLDTYREWGGTKTSPTIAILDWPDQRTTPEQRQQAADLTRLGCPALVCTPAELEVHGGRLYARGEAVDIVHRRVLLPEIVKRSDELVPFLTAYRERLACVVNPMRSYLLGCKALLAIMRANGWYAGLSDLDKGLLNQVLPETVPVSPATIPLLQNRDAWVVKPAFGSGGKGVVIGRFSDEATWARAIANAQDGRWIAQAYVPIPSYSVPVMDGGHLVTKRFFANWNPFFFDGVFAGAITRASLEPVVGISAGGALLPAVVAHE